ncbi:hypothetical protein OIE68_02095 [Nocardia vinacea]|uniref:UTRA domain-containing protein n=1 Tax=Nocardia vinacea TaxID=96468 RepID=A0ABZ1YRA9_9NOCA|nr:hypothetical protein OIE68_02095 [Nocardia vinacea]
MLLSSPIFILASPRDRAVVIDSAICYRPDKIEGRRYHITATTPERADQPALE